MPGFIVDPLLVTTPLPESTDEEVGQWFRRLEQWMDEIRSSPFPWRHFLACTFKLQEMDRFPTFSLLRDMVRQRRLDVNVRRLMSAIDSFFQDGSMDLLGTTATRFALVREDAPEIRPAWFIARNLPELQIELSNGLLCLACDKSAGEPFSQSAHLVTVPLEDEPGVITVRGDVVLTDPDDVAERMRWRSLEITFPLLFRPDDYVSTVDEILDGGFDVFRPSVVRLARRLYGGVDLLPFVAGREFWESLWDSTIATSQAALERLLRICAAVIANRLSEIASELQPIRSSGGPTSPQRVRERDHAKAWRVTITRKGVGWRLHYWHVPARLPDWPESVELANVMRARETPRILE